MQAVTHSARMQNYVRKNAKRDKYLSYSCDQLLLELRSIGAIQSDAQEEQGLTATQAIGDAPTGGIARPINMSRTKNAKGKADQQIKILYEIWDDKKCSEEIYEKTNSTNKLPLSHLQSQH